MWWPCADMNFYTFKKKKKKKKGIEEITQKEAKRSKN
jgi:hypothetical protein